MKFSMRARLVSLVAVFLFFFAGSAWAQSVQDVANYINSYDGLSAAVSGNTVSITGSKIGATTPLVLGSISGGQITYNWNATLTADCETFLEADRDRRALISFRIEDNQDVVFNINGGEISLTDKALVRTYDDNHYMYVIYNHPRDGGFPSNVHVVLNGGAVSTDMTDTVAINLQSREVGGVRQGAGRLDLESGTFYAPFDEAVEADDGKFTINEAAVQSGELKITGLVDGFGLKHRAYGNTIISSATTYEPKKWADRSLTVMDKATLTIAQNVELGVKFSIYH
ncbi:hypothetical protein FACS1894216_20830 [Synergistales bacterium]|nr:hypothetical protein FACS1894216_20830 [Synergistales bacterium]